MADETKELNFKLTTTAELAGAQQLATSLEQQIGKAKVLKQDYSELAEQLKSVKASIQEYAEAQRAQSAAANDVIEVTKEDIAAAEADALATDELAISKRELREAIRGLGLEFPELDRLVHVVTSSIGIAFGSVAAAVGIWVERMRDANAEAQRFEFPDVAQMIKPIQDVTAAWDGLADAIQRANDNYASAEQSADRAIKKIGVQLTQEKELLSAEKELALAKLESQKGSMSPEEYAKERGQIESAFGEATVAADERARRAEETARENEAANLDIKARQEAAAAGHLPQAGAMTEKQDEEAIKKAIEELNKKIGEQSAIVEKGREWIKTGVATKDEFSHGEIGAGLHDFGSFALGALPEIFKGYGTEDPNKVQKFREEELKNLQDRLDALQKTLETRQGQIKQRDDLRQSASKDEQSAQTIRDQLHDQQSSDAAANKTEEAVQNIRQQTDKVGEHIERMGNATAQGLKGLSQVASAHATTLEQHAAEIEQLKTQAIRIQTNANNHF